MSLSQLFKCFCEKQMHFKHLHGTSRDYVRRISTSPVHANTRTPRGTRLCCFWNSHQQVTRRRLNQSAQLTTSHSPVVTSLCRLFSVDDLRSRDNSSERKSWLLLLSCSCAQNPAGLSPNSVWGQYRHPPYPKANLHIAFFCLILMLGNTD